MRNLICWNSTGIVFENRSVFEVMSAIKAFLKNAFIVMCDVFVQGGSTQVSAKVRASRHKKTDCL